MKLTMIKAPMNTLMRMVRFNSMDISVILKLSLFLTPGTRSHRITSSPKVIHTAQEQKTPQKAMISPQMKHLTLEVLMTPWYIMEKEGAGTTTFTGNTTTPEIIFKSVEFNICFFYHYRIK